MAGCEREKELSSIPSGRLATSTLGDHMPLVRRNIFSRDATETLRNIMLTAITFDSSAKATAWFSVGTTQATQMLHRGDTLKATAHQVELIDIQPRLALLELDGQVLTVKLGQTLQEALGAVGP